VMMYVRYPLSLRQVEDFLFERGIDICHETVRFWWNRFGPMFAADLRRRRVHHRSYSNWRWHLDEVFVRINGETHYLWRAVDHEGEVLEVFATKRRDSVSVRFQSGVSMSVLLSKIHRGSGLTVNDRELLDDQLLIPPSVWCTACGNLVPHWETLVSQEQRSTGENSQEEHLTPAGYVGYFEMSRPSGSGLCAADDCPCGYPGADIPRGDGYLHITKEAVESRRDTKTEAEHIRKMERLMKNVGGMFLVATASADVMCALGAKKRRLDMKQASEDAAYWWKTGKVPLRPTREA